MKTRPFRVVVSSLLGLVVLVGGAWGWRQRGDLPQEIALAEVEALRLWRTRSDCGLMRLSEYGFGRTQFLSGSPFNGTVQFFLFGIRVSSIKWDANDSYDRGTELLYWFHGSGPSPAKARDLCAEARARLTPVAFRVRRQMTSGVQSEASLDGVPLRKVKVVSPGPHRISWSLLNGDPLLGCSSTLVSNSPGEGRIDWSEPCPERFELAPVFE